MFNYQQKIAGLLLHISSLPSGSMCEDAYRFIDLLKGCGCQVWQTLPVNMTHGDKSPYNVYRPMPAILNLSHSLNCNSKHGCNKHYQSKGRRR